MMTAEKPSESMLSLEAFADMVLEGDAWKDQMPGIMAKLPSVDDAIREMAYMPDEKRHALREKVARMQGEIGNYIHTLGEEMRVSRSRIESAKQGTAASNAYQNTAHLAGAAGKKDGEN